MKPWKEIIEALEQPLDKSVIKTLKAKGNRIYIDGEYVTRKANEIFGVDGWSEENSHTRVEALEQSKDGKWHGTAVSHTEVVVRGITEEGSINERGVHYTNEIRRCAEGSCGSVGGDKDRVIETIYKGAATDARKRGFSTFGDPFGLCLGSEEYRNSLKGQQPPRESTQTSTQASGSTTADYECPKCSDGPMVFSRWKAKSGNEFETYNCKRGYKECDGKRWASSGEAWGERKKQDPHTDQAPTEDSAPDYSDEDIPF